DAPAGGAGGEAKVFTAIRSLGVVRGEDRWFAGVCGGAAQRLGVDPLVVRGVLIALTVVGGLGLALYGICWALLPDGRAERRGRIEAEAAARGDVSGALALAVALVVADLVLSRGVVGIGPWDIGGGPGWGLLVTSLAATLAWWVLHDHPAVVGACARSTEGANPEGANPEGANPEGANPEGANPEGANPEGANPEGAAPAGATPTAAPPRVS
ncbi:PspC domain-containing protein, partial [Kineococcus vitellinus]|uniref:PspC domain-containing protein n=1 Tax=Kineococcus vitellinus TaxID=2696565 RepID=UPI00196B2343